MGYFIAFGIAVLFKMPKNSCVAISIECSNQNIAFAMAIMILTLGESDSLDIALGIPILYGSWNIIMVLIIGGIFRRCGYLEIDEDDKSMSLRKLIKQWREKKNGANSSSNIEREMAQHIEVEPASRSSMNGAEHTIE